MAPLTPNYTDTSDPDEEEIFTPMPKIIKYDNLKLNDKENRTEKKSEKNVVSKKNHVPSNITCHCAGNTCIVILIAGV